MKDNLAKWSIEHKQLVYFLVGLIAIMGVYSYMILGRQEDPSFPVKQMVISAAWPGATASQMEKQVTDKLEKKIQTVADMDYITSYSRPGQCVITANLKETTSAETTRLRWQEIRNFVADARGELPADLYGPYFNDHFEDVYGNVYAVTSDSFSLEEMRKVASRIKDRLVQVPDVKKVELEGVQPEKIYIQLDNSKLSQLGMSVDQLAGVIAAETSITPAALKHNSGNNIYLRLTGTPDAVEDIENLPISGNGRTLRLGDVAKIERSYADPAEPKMYFNGKEAIGISVSMVDGGNNLTLGENLEKFTREVREDLPLGFELHQVLNQPQVVKDSIREFMESLLEAIIIVLVVSLLTLGRQCGYVVSFCIPFVLMCSFVGMYVMGIDLHKISLGSLILALGMLVDDSVVVIEMIELKINEGWDRIKACSYAFESCAKPLLTGTMITCASFMPVAFARSMVGEYAASLFPVITVTLMSSWLVSATIAPVLAHAWVKKRDPSSEGEGNDLYQGAFYQLFRKLLNWSLHNRKSVIAITLAIFFGSIFMSKVLKQEFFPASVRPELLVDLNLPEGSSLEASQEVAEQLTELVLEQEETANVSTYVGKSAPRFVLVLDPVQPRNNFAQLVIVAKDLEARERLEKTVMKIIDEKFPEVQSHPRSIPLGPPTPYPVMFRVSAMTHDEAKTYAAKLRSVMQENPHITAIQYDWMEKTAAVRVELDDDKLRQMGLTRKTISSALYAEISGYSVSKYYEGDQAIDMVFRLEPRDHSDISSLGTLPIPTAGGVVQLNQVAKLSYEMEDGMIWRRDLLPTITVQADIVGGVTGNDITNEILKASADLRKELPPGVTIEAGGPFEKSVTALASVIATLPAMFVTMLVLLIIMLQDVKKLFVVLCTAPLSFIGVVAGLFLFNTPMSFMAQIGFLALIGTVIRNATVLSSEIDQNLSAGMPPIRAVRESAIVRFRPIMLTALTTVLGLIPMFPSVFWRGLAIAIACGLLVATIITLIVMPVIYCMVFHIDNEAA